MNLLSQAFQITATLVLFTLLTIFMILAGPSAFDDGVHIQLFAARNAYPYPEATRDSAPTAAIAHDGKVFFGRYPINPVDLPDQLHAHRLGSAQPLFIQADQRARYARVKSVIDSAQAAGIRNVVFLVEQHRN